MRDLYPSDQDPSLGAPTREGGRPRRNADGGRSPFRNREGIVTAAARLRHQCALLYPSEQTVCLVQTAASPLRSRGTDGIMRLLFWPGRMSRLDHISSATSRS
jgi:hypothetical protein